METSAAAAIAVVTAVRNGEMLTSQNKAGRRVGARFVSKPVIADILM